ncbi:putative GPI-anchored surface protein [Trypanosoma theileri]|uniref:Putative GPI-anchored surface protein n=1 Tax=Trypanosoma theileri TaxID=67003 RepID=A0A1X0NYV0_9TRYP|nr:putative GPI-anchored surface protein [Trypanosoma theileri]ORC89886.1 putative GPI-anchored surface protein [Trypanosoma theileri]
MPLDVVDAIVVLGGGSQRNEDPASLPWFVLERLDAAYERYHTICAEQLLKGKGKRPKLVLLSAGTTHKPNYINHVGWPIGESTSGALYLLQKCKERVDAMTTMKKGKVADEKEMASWLTPHDIIRETSSLDTIGNAYFLRTVHADPAGWRHLHVITSDFHLPRTRAVFEFIFACDKAVYNITYEGIPSAQRNKEQQIAIQGRSCKERNGLQAFYALVHDVFGVSCSFSSFNDNNNNNNDNEMAMYTRNAGVTLQSVHEWLFTQHLAYCTHEAMVVSSSTTDILMDAETLQTY